MNQSHEFSFQGRDGVAIFWMAMLMLTVALLVTILAAQAAHASGESPAPDKNKTRLVQILDDALRNKDITKTQYAQSIAWIDAAPCARVDRGLTDRRRVQLEAAIAKEQKRNKVKVFESFKSGQWLVLFTDASDGDSPYLFYAADPADGSRPVTVWSGGATIFETSEVAQWVKDNAPGIPVRLANCFAWHVTLDRQ